MRLHTEVANEVRRVTVQLLDSEFAVEGVPATEDEVAVALRATINSCLTC